MDEEEQNINDKDEEKVNPEAAEEVNFAEMTAVVAKMFLGFRSQGLDRFEAAILTMELIKGSPQFGSAPDFPPDPELDL